MIEIERFDRTDSLRECDTVHMRVQIEQAALEYFVGMHQRRLAVTEAGDVSNARHRLDAGRGLRGHAGYNQVHQVGAVAMRFNR